MRGLNSVLTCIVAVLLVLAAVTSAEGQRLPFERSFAAATTTVVDIVTDRGAIDVTVGDPGRVVVAGTVTVRFGWNVPADALQMARRLAAAPPITIDGGAVRLREPADPAERSAVTVSYRVAVPPGADVRAISQSGAISVADVAGPVTARTQSSRIELVRLRGSALVTTGSGAVIVDGIAGALDVTTASSGFTAHAVGGDLKVRTESGAVRATLAGHGRVEVSTESSAVNLRRVRGPLLASSLSGHLSIDGQPDAEWNLSTASSAIDVDIHRAGGLAIDATSGSGSARVDGPEVRGAVSHREVRGSIGGAGPLVRARSRSGSIVIRVPG